MDKLLYFYEVNSDYITYLHSIDSKVPRLDYSATGEHDKFMFDSAVTKNKKIVRLLRYLLC